MGVIALRWLATVAVVVTTTVVVQQPPSSIDNAQQMLLPVESVGVQYSIATTTTTTTTTTTITTTTTTPPTTTTVPEHEHRLSVPSAFSDEVELAILTAAIEFGLDVGEMRSIAFCESRGDVAAISYTDDHGLFQHNGRYGPERFDAVGSSWESRYDALQNARAAGWYRVKLGRWGGSAGWVCAAIVGLY